MDLAAFTLKLSALACSRAADAPVLLARAPLTRPPR
jgi:hypothetical protein